MEYKFNLNDKIKVKLTDAGYQHMANYENDLLKNYPSYTPKTIEDYKSKVDTKGYYTFQTWEFMQIYGSIMCNGMKQHFEMNIVIDSNDLKQI